MSLRFSAHYADPLFSRICFQPLSAASDPQFERAFREIDTVLTPPFSADAIRNALEVLRAQCLVVYTPDNKTYGEMQRILVKKVALGLYASALDLYLSEATSTQEDAEWWTEVEQSVWSAALYLLQSMSFRSSRARSGLLTQLKHFLVDFSRSFSCSS